MRFRLFSIIYFSISSSRSSAHAYFSFVNGLFVTIGNQAFKHNRSRNIFPGLSYCNENNTFLNSLQEKRFYAKLVEFTFKVSKRVPQNFIKIAVTSNCKSIAWKLQYLTAHPIIQLNPLNGYKWWVLRYCITRTICTADRQTVALSLDLSTRYTGHILSGRRSVCFFVSRAFSHTYNKSGRAKYLDYFIKIINSISFGKNLIHGESGPASARQTLEHMLNNAEKAAPFSQKWIKSSHKQGADAIKPEPGFCGSCFGFFQSIRGPFCWTLSSIER